MPCATLSLNECASSSCGTVICIERIQVSSVTSGTSLCTQNVDRFGSMPSARKSSTTPSMFRARSSPFSTVVIA